jgi:glycosyltransferase involved in cell wall biosynthesis
LQVLMVAACPLPWPRGTPIRVHRMAEALSASGHAVTVVTYPLGDSTAVPYEIVRVAQHAAMAGGPGPSVRKLLHLDPLLYRAVTTQIDSGAFDVIHAHHYEGLLVSLAARTVTRSLPLVYDAHTLLATELPQYRIPLPGRMLAGLGAQLDRRLPGRADHIIAVSRRMRDWFLNGGGVAADRISLVPNGVEHEHFRPASQASSDRVGAEPDRTGAQIVFAGNLAEYQGLPLLLEAFARVRQVRADARLRIVTGSDPRPLYDDIARLGLDQAVSFAADDYALLPARLAAADVLVNPRINCDGLPQKLLNYMAAGRPIVSFAGSAALLEHDHTGLVVPDADTAAFADAVLRLLDDIPLGERLGAAARQQVVDTHGWQNVAVQVTAVYESVVARRGDRPGSASS